MVTEVGAVVYLALLLDRTLQPLSLPSPGRSLRPGETAGVGESTNTVGTEAVIPASLLCDLGQVAQPH